MYRKLILCTLALFLAVSACDLHVSLPVKSSGPMQVDEIGVPAPSAEEVVLTLNFGTGTLNLKPGAGGLVSGTASYNIPDFKPILTVEGGNVTIEQGNYKLDGLPDLTNIKNTWDLKLGTVTMSLVIQAGAYKAVYDLGGLSLTSLTVKDGAADTKLDFSALNKVKMTSMRYETGASNVSLTNLANANVSLLVFKGGAGNYTIDFRGDLQQEISATIETGVSNMTLVIPQGVPVTLTVEGGLSNVTTPSGWTKNQNVYTQTGEGPALTILLTIAAGNLTITH